MFLAYDSYGLGLNTDTQANAKLNYIAYLRIIHWEFFLIAWERWARGHDTWQQLLQVCIGEGRGGGDQRVVISDSRSRRDVSSCFQNILIFPRKSMPAACCFFARPFVHQPSSVLEMIFSNTVLTISVAVVITFIAIFWYHYSAYFMYTLTTTTVVTVNFTVWGVVRSVLDPCETRKPMRKPSATRAQKATRENRARMPSRAFLRGNMGIPTQADVQAKREGKKERRKRVDLRVLHVSLR